MISSVRLGAMPSMASSRTNTFWPRAAEPLALIRPPPGNATVTTPEPTSITVPACSGGSGISWRNCQYTLFRRLCIGLHSQRLPDLGHPGFHLGRADDAQPGDAAVLVLHERTGLDDSGLGEHR